MIKLYDYTFILIRLHDLFGIGRRREAVAGRVVRETEGTGLQLGLLKHQVSPSAALARDSGRN